MQQPFPGTDWTSAFDPNRVDEFMVLFTRHSTWLRGFVIAQVPNWADAEEVLQNTNSVLWRKFHQFTPGSDFIAWACQIARNEILHYRRSKGRERLRFGDEFVGAIADEAVAMSAELDELRETLALCMQKLTDKDRRLIEERYRQGASTRSVALTLGRSIDAIYKGLGRVRKLLLDCMKRELEGDAR